MKRMITPTARVLADAPDAMLVGRAVDGDTDAFGEIVRRHSPLMRAYVSRIVGSLSEADDVVQETFVVAWRELPALRDPAALKTWLMRIASRQALTFVRRRPRDISIDVDLPMIEPRSSADMQPEAVAIRRAQLAALSAALDTLPENERRCWLLREIADLSYAEIAAEMEIPLSTVRGYLARARVRITTRMEGWR